MMKRHLQSFLTMLLVCGGISGYAQTYCVTSPSSGGTGDIITKVGVTNSLAGVYTNATTYSTAAPAYYTSYSNTPLDLYTGTSNTIAITFGTDVTQYSAVWIDYNRDGVFQASENVGLATSATGPSGTKTYTFTVPAGATPGVTTLRVRGGSDNAYTAAGACTASSYGETEDYKVNITNCFPVTAVTRTSITATSATVSFTAPTNTPGNGYDYFYTTTSTPPAANATPSGHVSSSPINMTGDFANNPVYVWVRSSCSATSNSSFSTTSALLDPYCTITGSTSAATYINNFQTTNAITNITNSGSGFSTGGYLNATNKSVTQKNGGSVSFSATVLGGTVGIAVWVDWNDNGTFDSGERVYTSGTSYVSSASGSFTVPAAATPGKHRMRVVADYYSTTPTACAFASGGQGEVEDYTFNVQPKAPVVAGTATICPGATTTISASSCTGTIKWSNGAVGSSINVPAGSYTATCIVDSVVGIVSTPVVVTNTVVNTPVVTGGVSVCKDATTTLSANGCSGGTITWSNGATGSNITVPAGSYTATCTVNGCVSPASAPSVVTEIVIPAPTIAVDATNCSTEMATLTASNYTGDVTWSNGETGTSITAPVGTYTATSSFNGCLSLKSDVATVEPCAAACPSSGNLLTNGSFDLGILPPGVPSTTAIVQPGWEEQAPGNNGLIETWRNWNAGVDGVDGNQYIELNYLKLGTIAQDINVVPNQALTLSYYHRARNFGYGESLKVEVEDLNTNQIIHTFTSNVTGGWENFVTTFTPTSDKIELRFVSLNAGKYGTDESYGNLLDDVVLNYNSCLCGGPVSIIGDTTICEYDNSYNDLRANGCVGGNISWIFEGYEDYPVVSPNLTCFAGFPPVRVRCVLPNCSDTVYSSYVNIIEDPTCQSAQQKGISNNAISAASASLSIAPNPVIDAAAIKLSGFENGEVSVQITNLNGSVISNTKNINVNGFNMRLDMSALRSGMYFIKVQQGGKIAVSKVTKR